jgi:hypothetical protein
MARRVQRVLLVHREQLELRELLDQRVAKEQQDFRVFRERKGFLEHKELRELNQQLP